ncbi:hypothetical protein [Gloeobacter kilaueensis]|uniref:Uncharacterized protein n=1 Tax=Gloeobacter kilaueensis (strain ATCC BAA-2537 / CCAP 1431/1 / ULC 316 / JS1) TaxID=1183438 RepID=U5QFK0_GLOK1|nr:hypothetical protein [Gloeobacter kilaueensis]AGY57716.1 hypothetical protein GKIL_1470 [Gloeobacter kilaueensis JS1]
MTRILEATYSNGKLILGEALHPGLEEKKLRVMIFEADEPNGELSSQVRRQRFLDAAAKHAFELPPDYKFEGLLLYTNI